MTSRATAEGSFGERIRDDINRQASELEWEAEREELSIRLEQVQCGAYQSAENMQLNARLP